MTNEQTWQAVLGELELTLSKANFTTWFKSTFIVNANNGEFTIGVPNGFAREWLQNKYQKNIARALQNVTSCRIRKISIILSNNKTLPQISQKPTLKAWPKLAENVGYPQMAQVQTDKIGEDNLNPRYTFETFIIGSNNELARAAAQAVVKNPGKIYNPLFIYGGVGLGKTHLVQAIGNKVKETYPKKKVVYVSSERFIEDFIDYIQKGKGKFGPSAFKNKYRKADFLLIDDIQFLAGKEGTQEEFFHTFNTLYQNDKQIILTSDRPPKAISGLEDRLVSRFEGGMIADITMPDMETRKAILKTKCREKGYEVPENVINYIAANIQSNIRELEGMLSRLIARCQLDNSRPTEELCRNMLTGFMASSSQKMLTSQHILETVSSFYNIKTDDLRAKNRRKEIAWPRQVAMYLMRAETKASYPTIGEEIGGRDHTTAIHACERVSVRIEKESNTKQEVDIIRQRLYNSTN